VICQAADFVRMMRRLGDHGAPGPSTHHQMGLDVRTLQLLEEADAIDDAGGPRHADHDPGRSIGLFPHGRSLLTPTFVDQWYGLRVDSRPVRKPAARKRVLRRPLPDGPSPGAPDAVEGVERDFAQESGLLWLMDLWTLQATMGNRSSPLGIPRSFPRSASADVTPERSEIDGSE
jgi:hypothetical protein